MFFYLKKLDIFFLISIVFILCKNTYNCLIMAKLNKKYCVFTIKK
ncbi:hypothetical protein HMPREF9018_0036 [Prevotella amnii CRIS 21A-A]|uniref:Uncharacterized protein n=1 Tax=Prevotella amnii CRIS 21A-A TaxID=679191 RepID=E1GY82_9BACT|nr:hypothetical protein HMPREF9018_0036 [Prevotella amnii CRIS 21A-A]